MISLQEKAMKEMKRLNDEVERLKKERKDLLLSTNTKAIIELKGERDRLFAENKDLINSNKKSLVICAKKSIENKRLLAEKKEYEHCEYCSLFGKSEKADCCPRNKFGARHTK